MFATTSTSATISTIASPKARYKPHLSLNLHRHLKIWSSNFHGSTRSEFLGNQELSLRVRRSIAQYCTKSNTNTKNGSILSSTASSGPPSCSWKNWVLGTLLSIILPFWKHKWAPLLALKKEVVMVVETIDVVTEVVEKAAEGVEGIAHTVAESLPDGGLQKAAYLVEQAAKKLAEEAHAADEFIHKVEETGKEIEKEVEVMVEAVIEEESVENKEVDKDEINK